MTDLQKKQKPFPWHCIKCGAEDVYPCTLRYTTDVKHDGRLHRVVIDDLTVPVCRKCGEKIFTDSVDEQVSQALRSKLRLLSPQEILRSLHELGLSQKELASRLGVAEATFSRWVTGSVIQSRAMDNLLRTYFAFPEVRHVLIGEEQDPELGARTDRFADTRCGVVENERRFTQTAAVYGCATVIAFAKAVSRRGQVFPMR